jgi:3-methyl-2-oxobutanoate hydroxymethyltransferase
LAKLTVAALQQMKRDGQKIVGCVCYDYPMARILDMAGADILSAGDSVGRNYWGHRTHNEVTLDEMVLVCKAVARGAERAVVSCDIPFGPVQAGVQSGLEAAIRLVKEGNAEMVKVDNAIANLDIVKAIAKAGIPVFTQFGFSPQSSLAFGDFHDRTDEMVKQRKIQLVAEAKTLEDAGASLLDCTGVTSDVYGAIAAASRLPVLGGAATHEADGKIGGMYYRVDQIEEGRPGRPNLARYLYDGATTYFAAIKAGRF